MSRFTAAASTSHTLSLAAMEEASRVGQRTADIDHLLLALVLNEQVAGLVLRSFGITLDATRAAIEEQHAEQLAQLGVLASAPEPGPIVFHETSGYEWSDRAIDVIKRANAGGRRGDAAAVLRELVAEPSGMIEAVLRRLGTTPDAITARLDEEERDRAHRPQDVARADALARSSDAFAPAPPERVWRLLADPARLPEWEPTIGAVENAPTAIRPGDTWDVLSRTERPDGKPLSVRPELERQQVELLASEEPRLIEWRFRYPDAPQANARRVRIELEPAAGGTQLRLGFAWERNPSRRRRPLLGILLRPAYRFALWMQLTQLAAGISRAVRS